MQLTHKQFNVLYALSRRPSITQQQLASECEIGLTAANAAVIDLSEAGLIKDARLTPKGMTALKPYAVDNAVILAAGLSSRFAPSPMNAPRDFSKFVAKS